MYCIYYIMCSKIIMETKKQMCWRDVNFTSHSKRLKENTQSDTDFSFLTNFFLLMLQPRHCLSAPLQQSDWDTSEVETREIDMELNWRLCAHYFPVFPSFSLCVCDKTAAHLSHSRPLFYSEAEPHMHPPGTEWNLFYFCFTSGSSDQSILNVQM